MYHARIIQHPFAQLIHGARLDAYQEHGEDLILDIQGLQIATSELFKVDNKIYERITGSYHPLSLKFSKLDKLYRDDFFTSLKNLVQDDPSRTIMHLLSWRQPGHRDIYYRIGLQNAVVHFFAQQANCKKQNESALPVCMERDWSSAPLMPERFVPRPQRLYEKFGGDPITIGVNGKVHHHRLFIGGVDVQPNYRPQVDAVLNLGEEPSRWLNGQTPYPQDRVITRGEGPDGMTVTKICEEVEWVIERLNQNQRVLVHCVAGMNRSTTICCAVLMSMEGLSAEAALERVREHHPWARPDSYHWLALRWLEINKKE